MLLPGEPLPLPEGTVAADVIPGVGVARLEDGTLISTLVGEMQWDGAEVSVIFGGKQKVVEQADVSTAPTAGGAAPTAGSVVHFRVHRVTAMNATGEIIAVGGVWCSAAMTFKGVIRIDDTKPLKGVEKCVLVDCFRPGDIVVGEVVALADARQYQISTMKPHCGVVRAVTPHAALLGGAQESDDEILLQPVRGNRAAMRCPITGEEIPRWVPSEPLPFA